MSNGAFRAANRSTQPFFGVPYFFNKGNFVYLLGARNQTSDRNVIPSTIGRAGNSDGISSSNHQSSFKIGITKSF